MKFGIDWSQNSTKNGAIALLGTVVALIFQWYGKDPMPVITSVTTLVGSLGLLVKD